MANCSTAFGTVKVEAKDSALAKKIATLVNEISSGFCYYISFDVENGIELTDNSFECSFTACGRWNVENNIENLGHTIKNSSEKCKDIIDELERHEFTMTFDYTDEEGGAPFICQGTDRIIHKSNTPIETMIFEQGDYEDFDYNVDNLINICGYDRAEALNLCGMDEEDKEVA